MTLDAKNLMNDIHIHKYWSNALPKAKSVGAQNRLLPSTAPLELQQMKLSYQKSQNNAD